jgi:hypothetical protein
VVPRLATSSTVTTGAGVPHNLRSPFTRRRLPVHRQVAAAREGEAVSLLWVSVGVVYAVSWISLLACFRAGDVDGWTAEDDRTLMEWAVRNTG